MGRFWNGEMTLMNQSRVLLKEVDRVEVLTLIDNYVDLLLKVCSC